MIPSLKHFGNTWKLPQCKHPRKFWGLPPWGTKIGSTKTATKSKNCWQKRDLPTKPTVSSWEENRFPPGVQQFPVQASRDTEQVVNQPRRENPALCRHWWLQRILRSPQGSVWPWLLDLESFAQCRWPGSSLRQAVRLELLVWVLPGPLWHWSTCPGLGKFPHPATTSKGGARRSTLHERTHQSHETAETWQGSRRWGNSFRDL